MNNHWEILAEAIQTILRKNGMANAYEQLKELTRGEKISQEVINKFVSSLELSKKDKKYLLSLTPETYTGLSSKLAGIV